jgi:tetratricopeptide (TPR) repeat protein
MSDKATQELIERAERLEEQGSIIDAMGCWEAVLRREMDPVFLCHLGRLALELGKLEKARDAFLKATVLDPQLYVAQEYLGIWHECQGNMEESLKHLNASLNIKETASAYTLRGVVQLRLCRVAEARDSFNAALNVDPQYEEAYYNLGISFAHEDVINAVNYFRKAVELDPGYAKANSELGWALRRLNENTEAEYHLRKAIELDETDAWAYIYLGNLVWSKGDLSSAEELFNKAIDSWPNSSIPYWCLAIFCEYEGRDEEAKNLYQQALNIDPDDAQANRFFGIYLKDIGQTIKAKGYLQRALELDPEDRTVRSLLANLD